MSAHDRISRRRALELSAVAGGVAIFGGVSPLLAETLRPTPPQTRGPFYPVTKPLDQDADLTVIKGGSGRAAGQVIHVMGRVLDALGQPLPGVRIEIWQANSYGRYAHPNETNAAPLDPNFEGYAVLQTDAQGRYRFKTIKPGSYPGGFGTMRAPHIHLAIEGSSSRLVTQMYFAGEPLNDDDRILNRLGPDRERLIVALQPPTPDLEPDTLMAVWDIVLDEGQR
jgi:protocatechuate 3,4-dioxygenase beta subunit